MRPAIIAFTDAGETLARRIAELQGGTVHRCGFNGEDAKTLLPRLFLNRTPIIGICAAGILIRLLAPHLSDKHTEPSVLAVSTDGASVVPLLGGHHGANRLARELSEALAGHAALTTASDSKFAIPLDEPPAGWTLANPADAKPAMLAMLAGGKLAVEGHAPWLAAAGYPISSMGKLRVLVTEQMLTAHRGLVYHPRTLLVGVGCERGVDPKEVIELIEFCLHRENLSPHSIAAIATLELKADEPALHAAGAHFSVPLRLYTVAELDQERYRLTTPSARVEAEVGTPGVAEAAALKAGSLLVPKHKSARSTCAIGRSRVPLDPEKLGRAPGRLHIVGTGPGEPAQRTAAAVAALDQSTEWVGYGLYLDLIADLRLGQTEHRFELGDEEPRVRHALELAGEGKAVALVSSGDAQIYAMATLVFELLAAEGSRALSDRARRVAVETHPGISAFQAASAAAGALIGHDFCTVSLSDLLTPRADILLRLEGAATAGFVTALYNPRSRRRTDLLDEAKRIFLAHRTSDTPVIVARNLGRPDQRVRVVKLIEFDPQTVDMLTVVLFGSNNSRAFVRGDGTTVAFTPRGYEAKVAAEPST